LAETRSLPVNDARALLAEARRLYDANPRLAAFAAEARSSGFAGGAEWMREALTVVRGVRPDGEAAFHRLGLVKYGFATAAAAGFAVGAWNVAHGLVPLAVVVFYVVECRMVFAFPMTLDGSRAPLRDSHRLVARVASPLAATATVMRLAAEMLVGGFCGRGFVRSWCGGCLAVLLWYERSREVAE
jgi:hypothetical protein